MAKLYAFALLGATAALAATQLAGGNPADKPEVPALPLVNLPVQIPLPLTPPPEKAEPAASPTRQFTDLLTRAMTLSQNMQGSHEISNCPELAKTFNSLEKQDIELLDALSSGTADFYPDARRDRYSGEGRMLELTAISAATGKYEGARPFMHLVLEKSCDGVFSELRPPTSTGLPAVEYVTLTTPMPN